MSRKRAPRITIVLSIPSNKLNKFSRIASKKPSNKSLNSTISSLNFSNSVFFF